MKKIFDRIFDDEVHASFLKFGRGEYKNKFMLVGKRQAKNWAIKTGAEYSNILVKKCLEKVGGPVAIKGVIVTTANLGNDEELGFEIKKRSNFQGVKKLQIDSEIEPEKIIALMDEYPRVFFALSFKGDNFVLKIKPKAPASGKPGKEKEDGPAVDFCSLKTEDKEIVQELFFGIGDFSEVRVNHTINVTDIVYPSNLEELKPTEVRELAKRKGVVIRTATVDGKEQVSEANFVA